MAGDGRLTEITVRPRRAMPRTSVERNKDEGLWVILPVRDMSQDDKYHLSERIGVRNPRIPWAGFRSMPPDESNTLSEARAALEFESRRLVLIRCTIRASSRRLSLATANKPNSGETRKTFRPAVGGSNRTQ